MRLCRKSFSASLTSEADAVELALDADVGLDASVLDDVVPGDSVLARALRISDTSPPSVGCVPRVVAAAPLALEDPAASFDNSADRSVRDAVTVERVIELTFIAGS
jgi:hypothetical protein